MVSADRFRLSIVLRRLCPSGFRWSAALWRFPAINRFAAVSACSILPPGFRLSTVLRRFLHRIFGCRSPLQRLCPSGFRWSAALWRFPAINRFAAVSAPDFWLPIAFAATLPVRFPVVCRLVAVSGDQSFCCGFRLLDSAARFPAVNCLAAVSAPDFWLPIAFVATFARPIPAAWLPGPAVSLLPGSSDPCGSGALAAAACGSRFSGRRAPEFRP